jgi:DNA-directed RNA polymerase specialized sigma subunit
LPNGLFLSQIKKYCQNWFMNDIFVFIRSNAIFKISNTTYRKLEEIKREIAEMEMLAKDNKVDAKTVVSSICSSECVDKYLFLLQNYNKPVSLEKVVSRQDDKEITLKDTLCDANDSISFSKIFFKDLMQRIHELGYSDEELERLINGKYLSYGEKKRLNDLREYCKNWVKDENLEDEINLVIDTPKGVKCCYRENKGNYLTSRPEAYKRH